MDFELGYLLGFIVGVLGTWSLKKYQEMCNEQERVENCKYSISYMDDDYDDFQYEQYNAYAYKKGLRR